MTRTPRCAVWGLPSPGGPASGLATRYEGISQRDVVTTCPVVRCGPQGEGPGRAPLAALVPIVVPWVAGVVVVVDVVVVVVAPGDRGR